MVDEHQRRRSSDSDDGVHWEITRQHANDITALKESAARQEEVLSSVLRGQDSMRDDMATIVTKVSEPPPATDLAKLIGTGVGVLTMFGALVYAYVSPLADWQKEADAKFEGIMEIEREQAYQHGVLDADLGVVKDHLDEPHN